MVWPALKRKINVLMFINKVKESQTVFKWGWINIFLFLNCVWVRACMCVIVPWCLLQLQEFNPCSSLSLRPCLFESICRFLLRMVKTGRVNNGKQGRTEKAETNQVDRQRTKTSR